MIYYIERVTTSWTYCIKSRLEGDCYKFTLVALLIGVCHLNYLWLLALVDNSKVSERG